MKTEFNVQNELFDAVKANDVAKAAKLLGRGAKMTDDNYEPLISLYAKPSVLSMCLEDAGNIGDLKAAMKALKSDPKYAQPQFAKAERVMEATLRAKTRLLKARMRKALPKNFMPKK